jgi:hypothetical protein
MGSSDGYPPCKRRFPRFPSFFSERPDGPEAGHFLPCPNQAVTLALANAVFHHYHDVRESIDVRITAASMIITSYPGPDGLARMEVLMTERALARR